jgi:ACS family glucarate transporter-like MFS transporter
MGTLLRLVARKTVWGVFLTQGCCAYTMLLFLFWLPSYLVQSRHMSLLKAGWFTSVPYIFAIVLGLLVGKLSDSLLTHEAVRQGKRRSLLIVFILMGFLILGGKIFGSQVPIATGYIVKWTGSFDLAFYLAGFLLLVAAVVCFTMTQKPLSFQENAA